MRAQPRSIEVNREGPDGSRKIRILIEPNHPRFAASLGPEVKRAFTEEGRYRLCERLEPRFAAALKASAGDPVLVCLGEDTFQLYRGHSGKVRVRFL